MKECFRGEGDKDEQALHCSRVLAVFEGKEKVLVGPHRFHHASPRGVDNYD